MDCAERVLRRRGQPVALTPKAFETLFALVENAGHIVAKEVLMEILWRETFVEESNLTFNIRQVRKALGDDARKPRFIETVARRGYRFIAPVEIIAAPVVKDEATPQADAAPVTAAPTTQPFEPPTTAVELPAKSNRRTYIALAFLLLPVVLVSGYALRRQRAARALSDFARLFAAPRIERLTDAGNSRRAALTPDGNFLAYSLLLKAGDALRLRHLLTDNEFEIVAPDQGRVIALAFAPDGKQLYFLKAYERTTALYRVAALGGAAIKLAENIERLAVAPDNRHIAFLRHAHSAVGQRDTMIMIFDTETRAEQRLATVSQPQNIFALAWSPDSASLACAEGFSDNGSREVAVTTYRVADGQREVISGQKWFYIEALEWLHSEPSLLIAATMRDADARRLWRLSLLDGSAQPLTDEMATYKGLSLSGGDDKLAAVQLNHNFGLWLSSAANPLAARKVIGATGNFVPLPGGKVVYSVTNGKFGDLWAANADGSQARQLTARSAINDEPAAAPDGRTIAFISNRSGAFNIWRMDADGGNQAQLTDGAGERYPAFTADGQWVLYNPVGDWSLWKVAVNGGVPVRVTTEPAMCPAASPDGKWLAYLQRNSEGRWSIIAQTTGAESVPHKIFLPAEAQILAVCFQWTPDSRNLVYLATQTGVRSLFRQPLDSNAPLKILDFNAADIAGFAYSADGRNLIVNQRSWQHDVVLFTPQVRTLSE